MYAKCAALLACLAAASAFHAPTPMALRARASLSSAQRPQRSVAAVGPKMQIDLSKIFGGAMSGGSATLASNKGSPKNGVREGDRVGILFLNLGGPEKLDEVEDFLFNLFNDEDIIRLPNLLKPLQGVLFTNCLSSFICHAVAMS